VPPTPSQMLVPTKSRFARADESKGDEVRPICGQCQKKSRACAWEPQHSRFRGYQHSSDNTPTSTTNTNTTDYDGDRDQDESPDFESNTTTPVTTAPYDLEQEVRPPGRATAGLQQSSAAPYPSHSPDEYPSITSPTASIGASTSGSVSVPAVFSAALPSQQPKNLLHKEGTLLRHYVQHLGRWLDGADPARQFTMRVPVHARHCPILLHAIQCFAACHLGDRDAVNEAYQLCIALLIERLNLDIATHDADLLCAIVILHYFEQLNAVTSTDPDNEQHLIGSSAILRKSQTYTIDPSSPTLREAAFWIYVRQCLFKSTIDQQPPNIDFSLRLHPEPASMPRDGHPLDHLRLETAWTNQMAWHCACVVNFCFDQNEPGERPYRMQKWRDLCDAVSTWIHERPSSFDPIWTGVHDVGSTFPEYLFTADWHGDPPPPHSYLTSLTALVMSSTYFHFSSILLLNYKPGPKFAIRSVLGKLSETDVSSFPQEHMEESLLNAADPNPRTRTQDLRQLQEFAIRRLKPYHPLPHDLHMGAAHIPRRGTGRGSGDVSIAPKHSQVADYLDHRRAQRDVEPSTRLNDLCECNPFECVDSWDNSVT
jgi:hypothetical protein